MQQKLRNVCNCLSDDASIVEYEKGEDVSSLHAQLSVVTVVPSEQERTKVNTQKHTPRLSVTKGCIISKFDLTSKFAVLHFAFLGLTVQHMLQTFPRH